MAVALAVACACVGAQPASGDATVETEFWRSAERMATPDAYRAYLAAYPNGSFAALARLKLGGDPEPRQAAVSPTSAGRLRDVKEAADTGSIELSIGDHVRGPAALRAGRLGARKQLVLPAGDWVVLAASDLRTNRYQVPNFPFSPGQVMLSTVAFGRFDGARLTSLMRYTFSSQPVTLAGWGDIDGCEQAAVAAYRRERAQVRLRDECASVGLITDAARLPSTVRDEVARTIERLGATVPPGPGFVSTATYADKRRGYLGISRSDWLGAADRPPAAWRPETLDDASTHAARVKALWAWWSTYRQVAADGFVNDAFDDAGSPAAAVLPDFDAAAPVR